MKSCCCSSSFSIGVGALDRGHASRCMVVSPCCSHFPMTCDMKVLFRCLFTTCVASLVRCLLRFLVYFLTELFIFLLSCEVFMYTLWMTDVSFANFSPSVYDLSFSFLHSDFWRADIFSFNEAQLTNSCFCGLCAVDFEAEKTSPFLSI